MIGTAAALLFLVMGRSPALPQENPTGGLEVRSPTSASEDGKDAAVHDVEDLLGVPVFNSLDEEIAEIEGLLVRGDRIVYARLGMGGFLGFGGEELVLPFSVLSFRSAERDRGDAALEAVIDTVQTPDQLKGLADPAQIDGAGELE